MTTWLFEPATDGSPDREVLDITLRFEGDVTVCALEGPLCAYTAPMLDTWLDQLRDNGRHRVIVDVSEVEILTSDGADVLTTHGRRLRGVGGALLVRHPSRVARRVLDLCDAGHLVEGDRPI